jgi:PAS domain-containing protein
MGLALILARELAANVAVPMLVVDATNTLVFYNEAAEPAFGGPFGSTGEIRSGEWARRFQPSDADGGDVSRHGLPLAVALEQHRPAHGTHELSGGDGRRRTVELTALPLFSGPDDFVGVLASFWERD